MSNYDRDEYREALKKQLEDIRERSDNGKLNNFDLNSIKDIQRQLDDPSSTPWKEKSWISYL